MTFVQSKPPIVETKQTGQQRQPDQGLSHLDSVSESSRHLLSRAVKKFEGGGQEYGIPRFIWSGPAGGGDTFRLGLFATWNGDEPEGAFALTRVISALEKDPKIARGYAFSIYPLCNPTATAGFPGVTGDVLDVRWRSISGLLSSLDPLAAKSANLLARAIGHFERDSRRYAIPCHAFVGPEGGVRPFPSA